MTDLRLLRGLAAAAAVAVMSGCVTLAPADERASNARKALTQLEADPDVKTYAPDELARAEQAVKDAEAPQTDAEAAATMGYVAQMRVQIAGYTATANRDHRAYEQLVARRDALRPGQHPDGLTTFALDALNASPSKLEFKPIGGSAPPPSPVGKTAAAASTSPPAEVVPQAATHADSEPHPLIALSDSAFAGGIALKPAACEALNKIVPILSRHVQRPVLVYFGTVNATALERASAVRDYLVAHGVARQRLFVAATTDVSTIPSGGVSVDFQ